MSDIQCTKANPWNGQKEKGQRVIHHDAREEGEQQNGWPSGDLQDMYCPNCGTRWTKELPQ